MDLGVRWDEAMNEFDELLDRFLAHDKNCVLHHEVNESQEFFQFAKLVSLLVGLVNIEPTLAYIGEGKLNNLFKFANPASLASIKFNGTNGCVLKLFELLETQDLTNGDVKDFVVN